MRKYIFFYFMKREPEKIQSVVPLHVEYWKSKALDDYKGGPFSDRSGGLITFAAENLDQANEIVANDPFVLNDLLENKWVKEWMPE
jgi:uncharacterized protein YciI